MVMAYLEVGKFDFFIIFIIINRVGRASSNSYASLVLSKLPAYFISRHMHAESMNQLLISSLQSVRKDLFSTCHACTMENKKCTWGPNRSLV